MSQPIPIPRNPHLISWKESLSSKILDKGENISQMKDELEELKKENGKHKKYLDMVYIEIKNTLDKVNSSIEGYSKRVYEKIRETKKNIKNMNESNSDFIEKKGDELFNLFRNIHKDACNFFSKKEYHTEPSELKDKSFWSEYIEDESEWVDWLSPIWSLEGYYKDLFLDFKKKKKIYDEDLIKINSKEGEIKKMEKELEILEKEYNALNSFSETISNISSNDSD